MPFELESDHLTVASERYGRNGNRPFVQQAASFAACVESRKMPLATGPQRMQVQAILDAIDQSSQTNRDVG